VLGDLRVPPGNRLEALKADRQGQHSIRINDQWRICFVWDEGGPSRVEIVDYHVYALAREVHVAPRRINEIVLGKRDVTADTDLRLARYFGLSEGFFLGLQMDYDLMQRRREIDRDLKTIRPRAA